jgi:hypothetical protein
LVLTVLIAVAVVGFSFFDGYQCKNDKTECVEKYKHSSISNDPSYPLIFIGAWARNNKEAIDPLAALGSFMFAGVLAFFTATLWVATRRLARSTAELSAAEVANSAELRKASDIAEKQLAIAAAQVDIQTKQHALARLEFLATHRPRLKVRHINVIDRGKALGIPNMFDHGHEVRGGLVVVNTGGSNATIIETRYRIFFSKTGLPVEAPYDEDFRPNLLMKDQILLAGGSCATPIVDIIIMERDDPAIGKEMRKFERGGWKIFVMGQIRYRDDAGAERFMGFCQERAGDGKFIPVAEPSYEYQD